MVEGAKNALGFFGEGGLHDGDVLVANDPYHGGGHLPDYNVFAPVFHDGEMVLVASIQCHHADTGGGAPGGYNVDAPDIWAEGVRFPALKVFERGVERRDVVYMMTTNNRTPTFAGDLRAQIGAAQLGVAEVGAQQYRPAEVGILQPAAGEVGFGQDGAAQGGGRQIGRPRCGLAAARQSRRQEGRVGAEGGRAVVRVAPLLDQGHCAAALDARAVGPRGGQGAPLGPAGRGAGEL